MPELPEVETTRRGLMPWVNDQTVCELIVRQAQLRWPVPEEVQEAVGHQMGHLQRRGKWLIWPVAGGNLLWHLGMSGSFRVWPEPPPPGPHDHIDLRMGNGVTVRYTDPRRFGALLWADDDPLKHPRLAGLGPEPLSEAFTAEQLYAQSRGRKAPIKTFIMDASVVVGVGNIYASEALYRAGIHPRRAAGRVSLPRYQRLVAAIVAVLESAIEQGGTSLRDFTVGDGTPGYFGQALQVYGRDGEPCPSGELDHGPIRRCIIGQRSTFYCPVCQR